MKIFISFILLCALASCAMPRPSNQYDYRLEPTRAEYDLQKVGPLIISNSPTSQTDCIKKIDGGGVNLKIGWIIRNSSENDVPLNLKDITLVLNEDVAYLGCLANNMTSSEVIIKPQDKVLLTCNTDIYPTAANKLSSRDTKAVILIPFGKKVTTVSSTVLLRIEDFE